MDGKQSLDAKQSMITERVTRRGFLVLLPGVLLALGARRGWAESAHFGARMLNDAKHARSDAQKKHPTPRPGIDASKVVPAKDLDDHAETRHAFALVRQIPQIADGIRCSCGCDETEGYYSLLSCFEKDGMAQHCEVCQGHIVLAHRLHKAGKSLKQIRAAIDAEF